MNCLDKSGIYLSQRLFRKIVLAKNKLYELTHIRIIYFAIYTKMSNLNQKFLMKLTNGAKL